MVANYYLITKKKKKICSKLASRYIHKTCTKEEFDNINNTKCTQIVVALQFTTYIHIIGLTKKKVGCAQISTTWKKQHNILNQL